jgi:hypothetical protein
MKNNNSIYSIVFVSVSCVLFFCFSVGIVLDPDGPQRQIFFLGMDDLFADFFNLLRYIGDRDPYYNDLSGCYFPLSYMILYPFSKLDNFGTMTLEEAWNSQMGLISVYFFIGFSIFMLLMSLNLIRKKFIVPSYILVCFALSYIFFFSIERGNTIVLAAAFVGFFIYFYDSENKNERVLAAVSLALAVTLKVYPVLFGFLYFEKKQYREIFLSAIITILLVFLPFLFFKRGFANLPKMVANMIQLEASASSDFFIFSTKFSPRALIVSIMRFLKFPVEMIFYLYNFIRIVIFLMSFVSIAFSCLIRDKWIKICLLSIAVIFFPAVSSLYCGLYLFPMIIIFFSALKKHSKLFNIFSLIVFIVFLNPYQIAIGNEYYFSIFNYFLINIVLLIFWIVLLVHSGTQIVVLYKNNRIIKTLTKLRFLKKYFILRKDEDEE